MPDVLSLDIRLGELVEFTGGHVFVDGCPAWNPQRTLEQAQAGQSYTERLRSGWELKVHLSPHAHRLRLGPVAAGPPQS